MDVMVIGEVDKTGAADVFALERLWEMSQNWESRLLAGSPGMLKEVLTKWEVLLLEWEPEKGAVVDVTTSGVKVLAETGPTEDGLTTTKGAIVVTGAAVGC